MGSLSGDLGVVPVQRPGARLTYGLESAPDLSTIRSKPRERAAKGQVVMALL